ncbi:MAG: bifunctional glutamate N-acetyltransferase/amino-acid acetyltransferase ArgJ [Planctomycetota bacterium]
MDATLRLPEGFRISTVSAGLAAPERPDLLLILADEACPASAVFTTNQVIAAPVALCREHMRLNRGLVRAILANSGSANSCTGPEGDQDAMQCAAWIAERLGCPTEEVLLFSTGVIGQRLEIDRIEDSLDELFEGLTLDPGAIDSAARAIMTTDMVPKIGHGSVPLDAEEDGCILGLAKGSGMIHPQMATMLAFFLTDIDPSALSADFVLRAVVGETFHHVSVDGDGSTNDSVLLWSSRKRKETEEAGDRFLRTFEEVASDLARAIARDGEGASKLIVVEVRQAISSRQAVECGRTIAGSLLVKTAVHGEDPNWGRILAAAGRSGVNMNTRKLRVGIGPACLFENDRPRPENEALAREHMKGEEVLIWIELAAGDSEACFYGCDLSADYVRINADRS